MAGVCLVDHARRACVIAAGGGATPGCMRYYAPDLNAVEGTWANMKNGLGNLAAADVDQLTAIIKNRLKASSTGPASSTASSPRPGSPSNPNRHRRQARPFSIHR